MNSIDKDGIYIYIYIYIYSRVIRFVMDQRSVKMKILWIYIYITNYDTISDCFHVSCGSKRNNFLHQSNYIKFVDRDTVIFYVYGGKLNNNHGCILVSTYEKLI